MAPSGRPAEISSRAGERGRRGEKEEGILLTQELFGGGAGVGFKESRLGLLHAPLLHLCLEPLHSFILISCATCLRLHSFGSTCNLLTAIFFCAHDRLDFVKLQLIHKLCL